jgi:stage II sporulation protein D
MCRSLLFLLVLSSGMLCAQQRDVSVGLLHGRSTAQVLVVSNHAPLFIRADGELVGELTAKDGSRISVQNGRLSAKSLTRTFSAARSISLSTSAHGTLRISTLGKNPIEREYTGSIEVRRSGGTLVLVNTVPIEEYVAGVVQSEAGDHKADEYYKLQAVSCRTYALTNFRKHLAEGVNMCDGTHCQVYKGRCVLAPIVAATAATKGMVVVDADIRLIHATFHSNCGGETLNAEDLWSRSEPYLVSTVDTFCLHAQHATWRKTLPRTNWLDHLHHTYGVDLADSTNTRAATSFAPTCRSLYIDGLRPPVRLEQIRADLQLNSAYFRISQVGADVVFEGRGFGHGVGLCQEGAMRMASLGYSFTDILHHYFTDVHLVDLRSLDFFRDEGQ